MKGSEARNGKLELDRKEDPLRHRPRKNTKEKLYYCRLL